MSNRRFRKIALSTVSVGALVLGTALFSGAPQASAATVTKKIYLDGNTSSSINALEVYFNSNTSGASATFLGNVSNYAGYDTHCDDNTVCQYIYVFSEGNGSGQAVKNNAASAYNNSPKYDYIVYYNSNYAGPSQKIPGPYSVGNPLNFNSKLKNNNASQKAVAAS